jgi:hypothetical protein
VHELAARERVGVRRRRRVAHERDEETRALFQHDTPLFKRVHCLVKRIAVLPIATALFRLRRPHRHVTAERQRFRRKQRVDETGCGATAVTAATAAVIIAAVVCVTVVLHACVASQPLAFRLCDTQCAQQRVRAQVCDEETRGAQLAATELQRKEIGVQREMTRLRVPIHVCMTVANAAVARPKACAHLCMVREYGRRRVHERAKKRNGEHSVGNVRCH